MHIIAGHFTNRVLCWFFVKGKVWPEQHCMLIRPYLRRKCTGNYRRKLCKNIFAIWLPHFFVDKIEDVDILSNFE